MTSIRFMRGRAAPRVPRSRRSSPRAPTARCRTPSPRDVEIPRDTLVVVDWARVVDGYCSDCTRTLATGPLDDEAREVYELVRSAQVAALAAVRAGAAAARSTAWRATLIDAAGTASSFGHGLGHGVGLEVHEAPRLGKTAEGALEAGNVGHGRARRLPARASSASGSRTS